MLGRRAGRSAQRRDMKDRAADRSMSKGSFRARASCEALESCPTEGSEEDSGGGSTCRLQAAISVRQTHRIMWRVDFCIAHPFGYTVVSHREPCVRRGSQRRSSPMDNKAAPLRRYTRMFRKSPLSCFLCLHSKRSLLIWKALLALFIASRKGVVGSRPRVGNLPAGNDGYASRPHFPSICSFRHDLRTKEPAAAHLDSATWTAPNGRPYRLCVPGATSGNRTQTSWKLS